MTLCGDIDGCHAQDAVNIGWYGYRSVVDVAIRTGPDPGAPIRYVCPGGKRIGRQSVRNPNCSDYPALRGSRNGFSWVYMIDGGITGWISDWTIESYDTGAGWANGPAGVDFHVGYGHCERGSAVGCGGSSLNGNRTINAQEVYLRYAPQSTAFHFLHDGDTVEQLYRSPMYYRCVRIISARWVPSGTRGWVLESAFA